VTPERATLRIGVMLNSLRVSSWELQILKDIQDSSFARVELVMLNAETRPRGWLQRWREGFPRPLFALYLWLDARVFAPQPNAFEIVDASPLLRDAEQWTLQPIRKRFVHRFEAHDIARIRSRGLDVIIRLGFNILRGDILRTARYGIWSLHHDDNREYRGSLPLFWEIYERNPVSGTILQILTEELDGGRVIYRSHSSTYMISYIRNKNATYWKTAKFFIRRLRHLHMFGGEFIDREEEAVVPCPRALFRTPTNRQMVFYLGSLLARGLKAKLRKALFAEQWLIGYRLRSPVAGDEPSFGKGEFRMIVPPKGRFFADPFNIRSGGKDYLFFEDFSLTAGRGRICWVEIDSLGTVSQPRVALDERVHLSYPFVFRDGDEIFMTPECCERRRIALYRATDFPGEWRLAHVLIEDIDAVDPTVLIHDGRYWLFANVREPGGSYYDELHLFVADSLRGPWQAHPRNPIVSDVRCARPAGTIFLHHGRLIRPAQDSSVRYGYRVDLRRIDVLSGTDYKESHLAEVDSKWLEGNLGSHTYNFTESLEVVDGRRRRLRPVVR
jgi:hypothetical protein